LKEKYGRLNHQFRTVLWGLVVICMLASLPLIYERYHMEGTSKTVEFVMDYRDLLDISVYHPNPQQYIAGQLAEMKKVGIHSLAVYESSLDELQESRRIEVYSSHEAATLAQTPLDPNENDTYVVFTQPDAVTQMKNLIEPEFAKLHVATHPWTYTNAQGIVLQGMIIDMPIDEAMIEPLDPDPLTMQMLRDQGFHIVARLSNRQQPFDLQAENKLLTQLAGQYGVKTIIVDGDGAPGYSSDGNSTQSLAEMANLMKEHQMYLAVIEPVSLKIPQEGVDTLAKDLNYQVVRLHSFSEQDGNKLTLSMPDKDLDGLIKGVTDRFVLAVKERNIRMVFLNAAATKNLGKSDYVDPLNSIYRSLKNNSSDSAIERIQKAGYKIGQAQPFVYNPPAWEKILQPFTIAGSVALIALMLAAFFPTLRLSLFIIGIVGAGLLHGIHFSLLNQTLALGAGVSAVSLAMITALKKLSRPEQAAIGQAVIQQTTEQAAVKQATGQAAAEQRRPEATIPSLAKSALLFIRSILISLAGVVFIIGLLNNITYSLQLQQFKGVNILALAPIVIAAIYLFLFNENLSFQQKWAKLKRILVSPISVIWVVSAIVVVGVAYYYVTRTGNTGQASSLEMSVRTFLENHLPVRPRTKEFLIGHPLFILGMYLCFKYRIKALYVVLLGAIGQASFVGTFTHIHTFLQISLIRVSLGMLFGVLIALALIVIWEICSRGWAKWSHLLNES